MWVYFQCWEKYASWNFLFSTLCVTTKFKNILFLGLVTFLHIFYHSFMWWTICASSGHCCLCKSVKRDLWLFLCIWIKINNYAERCRFSLCVWHKKEGFGSHLKFIYLTLKLLVKKNLKINKKKGFKNLLNTIRDMLTTKRLLLWQQNDNMTTFPLSPWTTLMYSERECQCNVVLHLYGIITVLLTTRLWLNIVAFLFTCIWYLFWGE